MPDDASQKDQVPQPGAPASPAAPAGGQAQGEEGPGKHIVDAFKLLALDPPGRIVEVYRTLGTRRAAGLAAGLGVAFIVCLLAGFALQRYFVPDTGWQYGNRSTLSAKEAMAIILVGVVIFMGLALGSLACRSLIKGGGAFGQDLFAAGVAVYAVSPFLLVAGLTASILGGTVAVAALLFGSSASVVSFYTAGMDLHGMSRKASWLMTSLSLVATSGIGSLICYAVLR